MSQTAYFATGCFWGAERRFWNLPGVIQTSVGYMGGNKPDPTYKEVCTGTTNHAEMVEVIFDPEIISYQRLLAEFWVMHDPTSLNQQGGDILTKNGMDQIVTEILTASGITYWLAEDYHQRYLEKNPNGYDCHSSTGVAFPTALASNNG
ncbi:MAG: peptide-methionine (S)-S-oxide reductase [Actinobacteria bacterium]|nr:peptide-methionine (S)-S-oxide reductase [Actinomycetota bacterium]